MGWTRSDVTYAPVKPGKPSTFRKGRNAMTKRNDYWVFDEPPIDCETIPDERSVLAITSASATHAKKCECCSCAFRNAYAPGWRGKK
jgi:hypothetical protein